METLKLEDLPVKNEEAVTNMRLDDTGQLTTLEIAWNYGETVGVYLDQEQAAKLASWLVDWIKSTAKKEEYPENYTQGDMAVADAFGMLLHLLEHNKPNDRGELDRIYAITRTEIQKAHAFWIVYTAGQRNVEAAKKFVQE